MNEGRENNQQQGASPDAEVTTNVSASASHAEGTQETPESDGVSDFQKELQVRVHEATSEDAEREKALNDRAYQLLREGKVVEFNDLRSQEPHWNPNLIGADLEGADLIGAKLRGANLFRANLGEADLKGAGLGGADLEGANLRGADLFGATLVGANLVGANLQEVQLARADLYRANLQEVQLAGADLYRADLRGANLTGVSNLTSEALSETAFNGATIDPALAKAALRLIQESLKTPAE